PQRPFGQCRIAVVNRTRLHQHEVRPMFDQAAPVRLNQAGGKRRILLKTIARPVVQAVGKETRLKRWNDVDAAVDTRQLLGGADADPSFLLGSAPLRDLPLRIRYEIERRNKLPCKIPG